MEAQAGKLQLNNYIKKLGKYDETDTNKCNEQLDESYDRFIAYTYIQAVNQNKAGKLDEDLANQFALKDDKYPKDLAQATNIVINYRNYINSPNHPGRTKKSNNRGHGGNSSCSDNAKDKDEKLGVAFAQAKELKNIKCFACGKMGHYATNCKDKDKDQTENSHAQAEAKVKDNNTDKSGGVIEWTNLQ